MSFLTIDHQSIDFTLSDYLQLVDSTGRIFREGKRGAIPQDIAPILSRLHLNPRTWLSMVRNLQKNFSYAIGHTAVLINFGRHYHCKTPKGLAVTKKYYSEVASF
ncbi:MAG TPA: hypothetical protein PLD88_14870 [Candidatus Berkiella sp.]|nr:hypothetical protein [Candidatus Berkiella sp.]